MCRSDHVGLFGQSATATRHGPKATRRPQVSLSPSPVRASETVFCCSQIVIRALALCSASRVRVARVFWL